MIRTEPKLAKRTIATIIDYGLYFTFFIWAVTTYGVPNDEGGYSLNGLKGIWVEIVWLIYFPIAEGIFGRTLGKYIFGLTVLTKSGNSISFLQAIKRRLLDIPDFFLFGIVAFVAIKNTPDHQRLGDLWAKTIVVGDDPISCPNCHDKLVLSVAEIKQGEFMCPSCNETVNI